MKRNFIPVIVLIFFAHVQASDDEGFAMKAGVLKKSAARIDLCGVFYQDVTVRAAFFAIKKGLDDVIVRPLVFYALEKAPSAEIADAFKRDITHAVHYDARQVRRLEEDINCGGLRSVERVKRQRALDVIRATPYFKK